MVSNYMKKTLYLAKKAYKNDDIPVAAIIVKNNKIIASAYNRKFIDNDVTAHAEILAIRRACKKLKTTYLNDCELYVTLEPCMMCSSAIEQSHIKKVIYCLKSPKYGYLTDNLCNKIEVIQEYDSNYEILIKDFFKAKR